MKIIEEEHLLRKNHSGMETYRPDSTCRLQMPRLRKNHSGMETLDQVLRSVTR